MSISVDTLLSKLHGVKKSGQGWLACCPAHDDTNPSLSINLGSNGRILLNCFAKQCSYDAILAAAGFSKADFDARKPESKKERKIVALYDYTDENNTLLFQKVRFDPKDFRCRVPKGSDWSYKLNGVRRVLYNLPQLMQSQDITICEGEKDSNCLNWIGYTATTNYDGAGKWLPDYNCFFQGKNVVIVPDNDGPGRSHAANVFRNIKPLAASVKIVQVPEPHKDVSDFFMGGGTIEEFARLCENGIDSIPAEWEKSPSLLKYHRTDYGAGEAFEAVGRDDFRFHETAGHWLTWDSKRWSRGDAAARKVFVDRVARQLRKEALAITGDERIAAEKYAHALESSQKITNALNEAKGRMCYANWDADPLLFNVQNGTIDLQSGRLLPHSKEAFLTKISPVIYDQNAESDLFNQFIHHVTFGDEAFAHFLQKTVGYSLTGLTIEEVLIMIIGHAATGKTAFINGLKTIAGDYGQTADFESFLRKPPGGIRNDIAALEGARLVCSIEVDEGKKLAEGLVKQVTGGDEIYTRKLYQEGHGWKPLFKLFLVANHRPRVNDQDDAMWRRIIVLPFENIVPAEKRDPAVKAFLADPKRGGAAMLAWAVKGCLLWQAEGLKDIPALVSAATHDYQAEMNPLGDFAEMLDIHPAAKISVSELRSVYDKLCDEIGQRFTLGPREFNERIEALGAARKSLWWNGRTQKCWCGVGIKSEFLSE